MSDFPYVVDRNFISADGYSDYRLASVKINLISFFIGLALNVVVMILYFCKKMDQTIPKNKIIENIIKKKGSYKILDNIKSLKILESSSKRNDQYEQ